MVFDLIILGVAFITLLKYLYKDPIETIKRGGPVY